MTRRTIILLLAAACGFDLICAALAQSTNIFVSAGETEVMRLRAEGAQIYECKTAGDGTLAWQFREPIATLMLDGTTIGRHYAGPSWEHGDGSVVTARAVANADGATPADIPWLKLSVTARRGTGALAGVTTVLRINTHGGALTGSCDKAGSLRAVPYTADYVFLRRDA